MRKVDLEKEEPNIASLLRLARGEPVLLLAADGREFILSEADQFDREAAALADNEEFQQFLDDRSKSSGRVSLDEMERRAGS